jgi:hypothetical protein
MQGRGHGRPVRARVLVGLGLALAMTVPPGWGAVGVTPGSFEVGASGSARFPSSFRRGRPGWRRRSR